MKKIVSTLVILLSICICTYYYCDNKKAEVIISGMVIGFDIQNSEENDKNNKIMKTSSKSIGTITFIKEDTHEFSALSHSISKSNNNINFDGNCYSINFDYIEKSSNNNPGKIIATINRNDKIGTLNNQNHYGIYGKIEKLVINPSKIKTENRFNIKKGDAYILLDIDNSGLKKYDVQIDEINYLFSTQNIGIKVTSEALIKMSGGIVQGMSGAPLIQNGKLIGAINCVNINDPLDAYAIFIDKLL